MVNVLRHLAEEPRQCTYTLIMYHRGDYLASHFKNIMYGRVKTGNFVHEVKLDMPLQTVEHPDEMALNEPSYQDFHCLQMYVRI